MYTRLNNKNRDDLKEWKKCQDGEGHWETKTKEHAKIEWSEDSWSVDEWIIDEWSGGKWNGNIMSGDDLSGGECSGKCREANRIEEERIRAEWVLPTNRWLLSPSKWQGKRKKRKECCSGKRLE